jgi:hypothetical protein
MFLIPNQIGPRIAAYRLNEKEKVGLLAYLLEFFNIIFWICFNKISY